MIEILARTYEYLQQGGWIMIPLATASVVLWTMMLERISFLRSLRNNDVTVEEAIALVRSRREHQVEGEGLRARVLRNFLARRSGFPRLDIDILRECVMRERKGLGKFLAMIGALVAVAPLMGLLGTVLGMIETFQVISLFGTGNANAMANGISIALITTEAGLLVAVPGLVLSGMLFQQATRLETRLEEDSVILTRVIRRPSCSSSDRRRFGGACDGERPEVGGRPVGAYQEGQAA
ncbi:MAG: MotA/TolQ/ExbB proton channel family protein [Candidatus Eisenbacteria bacterium]|nr:MotA/TolQ/ExbB proton channel family protein [Candidatus Eisenbacteria bacterium]